MVNKAKSDKKKLESMLGDVERKRPQTKAVHGTCGPAAYCVP